MRSIKRIRLLLYMVLMFSVLTWVLTGCTVSEVVPEGTPGVVLESPPLTGTPAPTLSSEFEALDHGDGELDEFRDIALHLLEHGELPDYYLTKAEARKLGWVAQEGNLHDVAPGTSIGGDTFLNRERLLPTAKGRVWYEADIHYSGGARGADRILYASDGLIYMTRNHYKTFTRMDRGEN
ncbi:ribonuclease domain-containing protein [Paenibacillus eucommiae]|uniref:Ribonuclease n=1 Tax=Paenibacillus eucommiae TaxID=1355755 RepID=A0ABS4J4N0_9BACL|nr:ribonuclease domain-containing protein [Paenibacillus eucommiae]MBP1994201.1 hypothetical protein [Paenibacillus eucommiae]